MKNIQLKNQKWLPEKLCTLNFDYLVFVLSIVPFV